MKLDATLALKSQGLAVEYACEMPLTRFEVAGEAVEFVAPPRIAGAYMFTGAEFFVRGTLMGRYQALCARCTQAVEASLTIDFEEEFVREARDEDPDSDPYLFNGDTIDLTPMAMDLITLNRPVRHLCREDCRGLCPVCGANLNETHCDCPIAREDEPETPFGALRALLHEENEEV